MSHLINDKFLYKLKIETLIKTYKHLPYIELEQIPTTNRHHVIRRVSIASLSGTYVLKEYSIPSSVKLWRKIELLSHMYVNSYAKQSFRAALRLSALNIPTFEPIATWQSSHGFQRKDFLLMSEIKSSLTLKQYFLEHNRSINKHTYRQLANMLKRAGTIVRVLNNHGIVHRDITLNNFLVEDTPPDFTKTPKLYLVDLERVRYNKSPKLNYLTTLYSPSSEDNFNRIELSGSWLEHFLHGYKKAILQ